MAGVTTHAKPSDFERLGVVVVMGLRLRCSAFFARLANQTPVSDSVVRGGHRGSSFGVFFSVPNNSIPVRRQPSGRFLIFALRSHPMRQCAALAISRSCAFNVFVTPRTSYRLHVLFAEAVYLRVEVHFRPSLAANFAARLYRRFHAQYCESAEATTGMDSSSGWRRSRTR
jgi:hypothetical protein